MFNLAMDRGSVAGGVRYYFLARRRTTPMSGSAQHPGGPSLRWVGRSALVLYHWSLGRYSRRQPTAERTEPRGNSEARRGVPYGRAGTVPIGAFDYGTKVGWMRAAVRIRNPDLRQGRIGSVGFRSAEKHVCRGAKGEAAKRDNTGDSYFARPWLLGKLERSDSCPF